MSDAEPVSTVKGGIVQYKHALGGFAQLCKDMKDGGIELPVIPGYMATIYRPDPKTSRDGLGINKPVHFSEKFLGAPSRGHVRDVGIMVMAEEMHADSQEMPDGRLPWVHAYTLNDDAALVAIESTYRDIAAGPAPAGDPRPGTTLGGAVIA